MNKQKVPKLRFPGFTGEWVEKRLGDVAEIIGGGTPDTKKEEYWNGHINWFTPTEIKDKYIYHSLRKISDSGLKNSSAKLLPIGTILFTSRATIGDAGFAMQECCTNQGFQSFIVKEKYNKEFIYYWICNNKNEFISKANGSTFLEISKNQITQIPLPLPTLPEQKRIADFLSDIDTKIEKLTRKKELTEQYKKGAMQKIFSQKIRFKDENGKKYPDWEEKRLGELGETYNGLTNKTKVDFGEGKPYIQYKQIFDDSKIDILRFDFVKLNEGDIQNKAKYGDVFFTTSSETPDEVGISSVLLDNVDELYLNSFCFGFRAFSLKHLLPEFSRYLFRNENFRQIIFKLSQGSTRYNISKNQFMKLSINLPCPVEQKKIAEFLLNLDTIIQRIEKELAMLKEYKRGLLQGMFV